VQSTGVGYAVIGHAAVGYLSLQEGRAHVGDAIARRSLRCPSAPQIAEFRNGCVINACARYRSNTAIYSIIHGALQLSYANADRMVVVKKVYPQRSYFGISWPDFLDFRSPSESFAEMAGLFTSRMTWRDGKKA
jgi:hypothetical protein